MKVLGGYKSSRAKASEIENAIKHHIKVNIEDDPEYYKNLSERLEDIIKKHDEKWDELVQMLLHFKDNIESDHKKQADDLGAFTNRVSVLQHPGRRTWRQRINRCRHPKANQGGSSRPRIHAGRCLANRRLL